MHMKNKIITMRNIAQELNISISTVNRALTGKGRISEETKNKVFKKAEEMGYKPNFFAKALSSKEEVRIGVICPLDLYFKDVIEGINVFYKELSHYNVKIIYKHCQYYGVSGQLKQIDECIKEKVDGIMLAAAHPILLNNVINKLFDLGIPTVTFNNDAPESKRICYIGQNSKIAGQLAAELMAKFVKPSARVAIMTSLSAGQGLKERTTNFIETIKNSNKGISIIGPFEYFDDSKSSKQMAREVIRNGNIDGIYANNMEGTRALGRAAKEMGVKDELVLIGNDSNDEIDKDIEEGIIDATIFQDPFSQGYYSLKMLFEHIFLKKKVFETIYYTRSSILLKSNLSEKGRWNEVYHAKSEKD